MKKIFILVAALAFVSTESVADSYARHGSRVDSGRVSSLLSDGLDYASPLDKFNESAQVVNSAFSSGGYLKASRVSGSDFNLELKNSGGVGTVRLQVSQNSVSMLSDSDCLGLQSALSVAEFLKGGLTINLENNSFDYIYGGSFAEKMSKFNDFCKTTVGTDLRGAELRLIFRTS